MQFLQKSMNNFNHVLTIVTISLFLSSNSFFLNLTLIQSHLIHGATLILYISQSQKVW
jgi:hypothetical protein